MLTVAHDPWIWGHRPLPQCCLEICVCVCVSVCVCNYSLSLSTVIRDYFNKDVECLLLFFPLYISFSLPPPQKSILMLSVMQRIAFYACCLYTQIHILDDNHINKQDSASTFAVTHGYKASSQSNSVALNLAPSISNLSPWKKQWWVKKKENVSKPSAPRRAKKVGVWSNSPLSASQSKAQGRNLQFHRLWLLWCLP